MEELLTSREKRYNLKDIVYDILPPKIMYCISDLRKYKWVKDEIGNRQIKTENGIKLKNGFDLHMNYLEAIYCGQKIAKEISTKLLTGNRKNQERSTE